MGFRGEKIKLARHEYGYTLREFARMVGISPAYLSEIERGKKIPSMAILNKITDVLNIPKTELVELGEDTVGISLGEKIKLIREEKGLTLEELAKITQISEPYLRRIETGAISPAVTTIKRLAQGLKVSLTVLFPAGNSLGEKLRMVREEQGLSQAELAKQTGVSPGLIWQIEHGKAQPSIATLERIAHALGTSVSYMLMEDEAIEKVLSVLGEDMRKLLTNEKVVNILRMISNMSEEEIRYVMSMVQLYKKNHPQHEDTPER